MLILFAIVILVALALQWYFVRNADDHSRIRYECRPSVRSCEPGEEFIVFSTVSNLGLRPSPVIRIEEHFPKELTVLESEQFNVKIMTDEHRLFRSTVLAKGRQQVKRYLRASISCRGEYGFSFADFHADDFLGLKEFNYRMPNDHRIVIYPPLIENADFLKAFSNSVDEIARRKQLLEDPLSVCGYRDYTGREPMRQISWTQSAVRSSLIVKQYDPVWQQSVIIALDMQYHGQYDLHYKRQELCFSIARTVCDMLEDRGIGYSLITNAIINEGLSRFTSSGGRGGSYAKILYALGAAKNGEVCTVEELMRAVCAEAGGHNTIVFISTRQDASVAAALEKTKLLTGGQVMPIFADTLISDGPSEEGRAKA